MAFDWTEVGTDDHKQLDRLDSDGHKKYLTEGRHNSAARHNRRTSIPHDDHGSVSGLDGDNHLQYLNKSRHGATSHAAFVPPKVEIIISGGASPEPLFSPDGDIIVVEVTY